MGKTGRLTSKCQVTVPKEIRRTLRLKAGDAVYFSIEHGHAVLRPMPESHAERLKGLGKNVWRALGGADRFLKTEREAWG